jgi:predicted flap endonuclease-1-like 5' DNA nuclease
MVQSVGRLAKGVMIDLPVAVVVAVFGRGSRRRRMSRLEKKLAEERSKVREHQVRVATLEAELATLQEQPKEPRVAKREKPAVIVSDREEAATAKAEVEAEAVVAEAEAEAGAGLQASVEVPEAEVLEEIEALAEEAEEIEAEIEEAAAKLAEAEVLEAIEAVVEEAEAERIVEEIDWEAELREIALEAPRAEPDWRDDLTRVQGIGAKSAERLNEAGIVSFAQLAALDEENLAAIIQAPDWRRPDYASWISQAQELLAAA